MLLFRSFGFLVRDSFSITGFGFIVGSISPILLVLFFSIRIQLHLAFIAALRIRDSVNFWPPDPGSGSWIRNKFFPNL